MVAYENNSKKPTDSFSLSLSLSLLGWLSAGQAWAQPRYSAIDLTPLLGDSAQISINDFGDMAGTIWIDELGMAEVFRLKSGQKIEWLGIYCSWDDGELINNQGQVAGTYWYDLENRYLHGFVYNDNEGLVDIGTLGGSNTFVFAFNNQGQVTGKSDTSDNSADYHEPNMGFRYTPGVGIEALGTLPGGTYSSGFAINDLGWVAGGGNTTNGVTHDWPDDTTSHTFRYTAASGLTDVGGLFAWGASSGYPTAMNNQGVIVGAAGAPTRRGFIVFSNSAVELPNLGGNDTVPSAINNSHVVVGRDILGIIGSPEIWRTSKQRTGSRWTRAARTFSPCRARTRCAFSG